MITYGVRLGCITAAAASLLLLFAGDALAQGSVADDKAALEALYDATDGANWTNNTNWKSTEPLSAWHGVTTDTDGRVETLYLQENGLSGTIPTDLGDLTKLRVLALYKNQLTGTIPSELGDMTSLQQLELHDNGLTGTIPDKLGDLSNLRNLWLHENELTGTIPSDLGNLTNLQFLFLEDNELTGAIPSDLGDLTNLQQLNLYDNALTGVIPGDLGDLTNLVRLRLHDNQLMGTIPSTLGNLTNLTHLRLNDNQLTGTIPAALGDLTNLTHLELHDNQLTGTIPADLGDLTNLTDLILRGNQLTGTIPASLANLTELEHLWLHRNQLTGTIPAELGNLTNLDYLVLMENRLSGTIPTELADLANLRRLYLSDNSQLTGTIPVALSQLPRLALLWLSGTCVTTPTDAAFLAWVETIDFTPGNGDCSTKPPANKRPRVSVSCDPCTVRPGGQVALTATARDADGDDLTYYWTSGSGTFDGPTDEAAAQWRAPAEVGSITIRVEVSDGEDSASDSVVVEVVNEPPTVSVTCEPCEVRPGDEVQLTATATDPDADELTYAWSALAGRFAGATDEAAARWQAPPEAGSVTIRAEVSDGYGGSASDSAVVEVTNAPPTFGESAYAFALPENVDGRGEPVELGHVRADDRDGDDPEYELMSGDRERFAIGARDGVVMYVGPGEDFETQPNRYELVARARDPYGLEAHTRLIVTVTNVNEPPEPVDDEASTPEDQAVTVDVLANDTDPEGDRLQVESVSAPSHGTTSVTGGGVRYMPEADFHGQDRFTYVVWDGADGRAVATVDVTVVPVNDAPMAVGVIPDQTLDEGGDGVTVELGPFFRDIDGDALTYRASSSDPEVAAVTVAGSVLTLTPVVYGSAAVTVTAEDEGGLTATQTFAVGVSDRQVREVVSHTLAGLARSHLASARMTLGRRVTASRTEESRLTILGRRVPLGKEAAWAAAKRTLAGWLPSWTAPHQSLLGRAAAEGITLPLGKEAAWAAAKRTLAGWLPSWTAPHESPLGGTAAEGIMLPPVAGGLGGPGSLGGFGGGSDPLVGSEFLLALGSGEDMEGTASGRRWQLWGQGDNQTFRGTPSEVADYDGELRTGYVGVDTWLTDRWLAGVAVARSRGYGDWRTGGSQGSLETTLTAVHPYSQWSNGTTSVWAMAGGGWGEAKNTRRGGRVGASGLGLWLGLLELRRRLGTTGGVEFGVRADASWAQLSTEQGLETIDGQTAGVNQTRVGADVSRPVRLGSLALAPFGEAHVRRDGGAGQTGEGIEVVAGLRAESGNVRVDAQWRMLAVHSAAGYGERGLGVTLSVNSQDQEGLSLSVSPRWGDSAAGGGALWQDQVYGRYRSEAAGDEWALDAHGSYGMRLPNGRLLTGFASLSHSTLGGRFLVVGGQVDVLD